MDAVIALLQKAVLAVVSLFVALGALVSSHTHAVNAPPLSPAISVEEVATSTNVAPSTTATSTPPKTTPAQTTAQQPTAATSVQPSQPNPTDPIFSTEEINEKARASLVNILCTTVFGGSFNPISGSGVIIDSRGIILTNAHVAQYFLLRDYPFENNIECVVRTGSPAQARYTAELMYLPPSWIQSNAKKITDTDPTGTGEGDYAFVRITGTTNPTGTLPSSFPALPMDAAGPAIGDSMVLAAYPAGFLGGISISLNLYPTSAVARVQQIYNFSDSSNIDLFSLGGTVVSQAGSSGGGAVSTAGKLKGLIANEVPAETTSGRDLRAITLSHIDRSLAAEGQGGIIELLSHDAASFAAAFNATIAPRETASLKTALPK